MSYVCVDTSRSNQLYSHNLLLQGKEKEAPKKNDRASPTKKTPPARGTTGTSLTQISSGEGRVTPGPPESNSNPSNTGAEVLLEKKYKEKLMTQVNLCDTLIIT